MSGIDLPGGQQIRKGAPDAILRHVKKQNGSEPPAVDSRVAEVAGKGATPLLVSEGSRIAGMVVLEDILKPGIADRFARLRRMGLRTVMVTGDNPLTAAAIAAQAGVDDFLAEATPEAKLAYIRKEQASGQAGRHDGRRHQRRPGPGPSRCRRGHELGHPGRQGSGQHGGSR